VSPSGCRRAHFHALSGVTVSNVWANFVLNADQNSSLYMALNSDGVGKPPPKSGGRFRAAVKRCAAGIPTSAAPAAAASATNERRLMPPIGARASLSDLVAPNSPPSAGAAGLSSDLPMRRISLKTRERSSCMSSAAPFATASLLYAFPRTWQARAACECAALAETRFFGV